MDNRTGFRPPERRAGGHAFHAQQARHALGLTLDRPLAELRTPIFHFAVGALVAGIAVLARPQRVGVPLGIALDVVLAVVASAALLVYDRWFCPPEARPGLEGGALPTAALLAESLVLAGTSDGRLWIPAAAVAALVIAVAPHLSAMRIAGRDGAWLRLARDAAGVLVMSPVLVAATSSADGIVRGTVLAAAAFLTTLDALHTEQATRLRGVLASAAVAVALTGALIPATRVGQTGAAAAGGILLVLWYGLRGLAVAGGTAKLSRGVIAEYGFFVVVAAGLLSNAAHN